MPYPVDHKQKTRARIVDAASRLFRRNGYQGTGVDKLMGEAGLTRGGFYAHFRDKANLFAVALDQAFDESVDNLMARGLEDKQGAEWLRAASRRYLADSHREQPELGCAVPTLGAEVAKAPSPVRRTFARRIDDMILRIADKVGADQQTATTILAAWVGALVMARATPDPDHAEAILDAVAAHAERLAVDLRASDDAPQRRRMTSR